LKSRTPACTPLHRSRNCPSRGLHPPWTSCHTWQRRVTSSEQTEYRHTNVASAHDCKDNKKRQHMFGSSSTVKCTTQQHGHRPQHSQKQATVAPDLLGLAWTCVSPSFKTEMEDFFTLYNPLHDGASCEVAPHHSLSPHDTRNHGKRYHSSGAVRRTKTYTLAPFLSSSLSSLEKRSSKPCVLL